MGLVNSALQIGRSALLTYQSALQVVGNNIANAGRAGYVRQSPILSGVPGPLLSEGFQPGAGVMLTALQRHIDEALEARLRAALSDKESALAERAALGQIESIINELSDTDLSTLLNEFFGAWTDLHTRPHDAAARQAVLTSGAALARELQRQRSNVHDMVRQFNDRIVEATTRANELAEELAKLNVQIVADAAGGGGAGSLRDRRDALLTELSQIVTITTREQPTGAVNVYVGNEPLVFDGIARGLATEIQLVDEIQRVRVIFADNLMPVNIQGGRLEGLNTSRDTHVVGQLDALNQLARALIYDVNRVHSSGQGLQWFGAVTGTYAAADTTAALNSAAAGYDFPPVNGSFLIKVRDEATGTIITRQIEVDLDGIAPPPDTTLESLRADIDAVPNVSATILPDGRLTIAADAGFSFSFAQDSSGVLAAMGINTFFDGRDARDIAINGVVRQNTLFIAAATEGLDGDGSNASRLAALGTAASDSLNGLSLLDFYGSIVGNVAVMSSAANAGAEAADVIVTSLAAQRESISGVSLDEEAVELARFQRTFQGAARYVTVVDELIAEMLALVR